MPADDLILNVRQIASYPPLGVVPPSFSLVLQSGLGGAYYSASADALVSTALQGAGPLSVGIGAPPADAVAPQIFTDNLVVSLGATHNWNCYFSGANSQFNYLTNGPAAAYGYDATSGFVWGAAIAGASGATAALVDFMQLTPGGELVLAAGSVTLGHDPIGPMQAATAQWVGANTVGSFNGRQGVVTLWVTDIVGAGGAQIFSPRFQGLPRADTPPEWSNSSRLATTAFVQRNSVLYIQNLLDNHPFVFSFNGRSGDIVLTEADITAALANSAIPYAPLNSPNFTGYATAPTPPPGASTGQIATTAFVMNAVADSTAGVASFNGRTGNIVLAGADLSAAGGALLASPPFTGTPTAPTAAPGTATTQLATTAFVAQAMGSGFAPIDSPAFTGTPTAPTAPSGTNDAQLATTAYVMAAIPTVDAGVLSFNGRIGAVTLIANDISAAGGAPVASPAFTGLPTAPTAGAGTSTTQLATTAYVMAALPQPSATLPLMNGTAAIGVSILFARADHVHPSDTSRAPLAAPAFTGLPTAPTAAQTVNNTQLATTAYVTTKTAGYLPLTGGEITGGLLVDSSISTPNINFTGPGAQISFLSGATVMGQLGQNTSDGSAFWSNVIQGGSISIVGDIQIACGGGHNFLLTNGVGFQAGGGAWNALSDSRIKTELGEFEYGLDAVLALRPINFTYLGNDALTQGVASMNAGAASAKTEFVGLVAQEAELAIPGMVTRRAGYIDGHPVDDLRSLNMTPIWFALINAVKELAARVAALEA